MPYVIFLARRYLYARHRGRAAQVTTLVAIAGVACGVAAFIIASALAAGFRDEMQDKILRGTAHITVTSTDTAPIADFALIKRKLEAIPDVRHASRTTYTGALLVGERSNAYAVVRGVDPRSPYALDELHRTLVAGHVDATFSEGTFDAQTSHAPDAVASLATPILIGAELAARTGLGVGSTAQIIAAEPALQSLARPPHVVLCRVVGVFRARLHDYDATWIYAPLASAIEITQGGRGAQAAPVISIETADVYQVDEVAGRIRETLGAGWIIVTWQEANAALFAALELERRTVRLIISLIMFTASLNILTTLVLLVMERRKQIAILTALGAQARGIMTIFIVEGGVLGAIGALTGTAAGFAVCWLGTRYEFVRLPSEVYSISAVPFHPRLTDAALACGGALLVSLLATVYPAHAAARVRPADLLRREG